MARNFALKQSRFVKDANNVYVCTKQLENKVKVVYERHGDDLKSEYNEKLIKKSVNVLSTLLNTASNNSNEGVVDVVFATWSKAADEIRNNAGLGIMDYLLIGFSEGPYVDLHTLLGALIFLIKKVIFRTSNHFQSIKHLRKV